MGNRLTPKSFLISSKTTSKSAPSRSILFKKKIKGIRISCKTLTKVTVWAWTPSTAERTTIAPSNTRNTRSTSEEKSTCPGVSNTLIIWPFQGKVTADDLTEIPRFCSMDMESVMADPRSTLPLVLVCPLKKRKFSVNVVLPASTCATMPIFFVSFILLRRFRFTKSWRFRKFANQISNLLGFIKNLTL